MDLPVLLHGIKRSHDGSSIKTDLTPDSSKMHIMSGDLQSSGRAASPALSMTSSTLSDIPSMSSKTQQPANLSGSPSKKRKLTFQEREVDKACRQAEKERRNREKALEKATREEAKRLKAEEKEVDKREKELQKARKEAEKVRKENDRDEKKRIQAEEKAKIEAEKLKKERAQMRLGAFFGRPAAASTPPSTPEDVSSGVSSRRSSVASIDMPAPIIETKPNSSQPDYYQWILPFFPHDHTELAPCNRFLASGSSSPVCIDLPTQYPSATSQPLSQRFGRPRRKVRNIVPVKTLVSLMSGSQNAPIDLTDESVIDEASLLLSKTPYKILSFREDVRPPYQGTYTRPVSPRSSRKLSRKPTTRAMPNTDYDYDSEAEWQAPEEGDEDIEDDDELSEDEAEADEMEDFLDDENDTSKRKLMTSDVQPASTGLCWDGEMDIERRGINLSTYRLDVLHDDIKLPIDPYSTNHWSLIGRTTPMQAKPATAAAGPAMQPPRLPLATLDVPRNSPLRSFVEYVKTNDSTDQKENALPQPQKSKGKKSDKPVKLISEDLLPSFKSAISGSDLNKVALVEILKKQFPSCPKDAIKSTLEIVAVRQGKKEVDKRWVLLA